MTAWGTLLHPRPPPSQRLRRWPVRLRAGAAALGVVLAVAALPGCGGKPLPTGELLGIQADQHRIEHPAKLGARATGLGCGADSGTAMASARRVAQFNLRRLTGEARYVVHFDRLGERRGAQEVCVEVAATAAEPLPYEQ